MRRSIAVIAIALTVGAGAYSQTLDGFKTAFTGFAGSVADSLALNSTIGSNWSDAYVGGFPHFGVGVTSGAAFVKAGDATPIFNAMGGAALPDALKTLGIPIPALGATFKIGLPFLPLDIGIKGGYVPPSVGDQLKSATGIGLDYQNVGIQLRYALLKQTILMPNLSIGASYNYQKGMVTAPSGFGAQVFTVPTDQGTRTITASDPALALGWSSNVFDFTAQVSKLLLFVVPYAGVGYTVGASKVTGGVSSTMSTNYPTGIAGLNSFFAANGGPTISDQGFTYTADANSPVFRAYGGLSIRIIVLDIDAQVMYVPTTKALGASATLRVQL